MKILLLVAALSIAAVAPAASRDRAASATVKSWPCDPPARWAARHDVRDAVLAITTEDGHSTLVLTEEVVAIQLSDRTIHKIDRKLKAEADEGDEDEDGPLGRAVRSAVLSSVRSLLDHCQEVPIRKIARASYRDGRLVFETAKGEELFQDIDLNDRDVMEGFSQRDARRFVREFHRVRTVASR